MPRGGRRLGAGRKPGKATKTSRDVAAKIAPKLAINGNTPLEFLLNVMQDEKADAALRLEAARCSAPYIHGRAAPLEPIHKGFFGGSGDGGGDINLVQVLAVPRGARVDVKTGVVTLDGEIAQLKPVEPHSGTPALSDQTAQQPAPIEPPPERLEVIEVDTANVTRLDFQRRRDDDDSGSGAA